MKKKHVIIIALSAISLLGIIFLQTNWIINVINLQKQQFETELKQTMESIKSGILQRAAVNYGYNPTAIDYENNTIQNLLLDQQLPLIPTDDIEQIIKRSLYNSQLKLDFEFALIKHGLFLTNSRGYVHANLPEAHKFSLNNENNILLILYIKSTNAYIMQKAGWNIAASILFTLIIFYAFILTNITLLRLRKASEITTDFFNNMTHELKTPIATINLAVDTLKNEKVLNNKESQLLYIKMIKQENNRMLNLVQRILESANSDEAGLFLNIDHVDIHNILRKAIDSVQLMLHSKSGSIRTQLKASNVMVSGDEVHLTNIINNLLDNAIKYSAPNRPLEIVISTENVHQNILIKISDNGIGMTKDARKNIFNKFYRVNTGNVHNVKGFGLGLSYVQTVVDTHKGSIKVDSQLNKGTTFVISLPVLTV